MPLGKRISTSVLVLLAAVALLLVAGRIYLPYWVEDYVNGKIDALEGYGGAVEDIDIQLFRGAYQIHGLNIHKEKGGLQEPFVAARTIDLSVEWRALLAGAVVAEIDIFDADLNFAKAQTGQGAGWVRFVDALSPFDINRLAVHGGRIDYIDYAAEPNVNIYIHRIDALVTNLRQVTDKGTPLPSDLRISGVSLGEGALSIEGGVNILRDVPDFDLSLELDNAALPAFNDYARSFAGIDFESGSMGVYSELAAAGGRLAGYVKLLASDVSVVDLKGEGNPLHALWEGVVAVFMEIFENQPQDQFAMRIPVEGDLNDPDRDMLAAFFSIFQNAFGQAFTKDTDGNITLNDALMEK